MLFFRSCLSYILPHLIFTSSVYSKRKYIYVLGFTHWIKLLVTYWLSRNLKCEIVDIPLNQCCFLILKLLWQLTLIHPPIMKLLVITFQFKQLGTLMKSGKYHPIHIFKWSWNCMAPLSHLIVVFWRWFFSFCSSRIRLIWE